MNTLAAAFCHALDLLGVVCGGVGLADEAGGVGVVTCFMLGVVVISFVYGVRGLKHRIFDVTIICNLKSCVFKLKKKKKKKKKKKICFFLLLCLSPDLT